jgi:hypothetical protein
VASDRMIEDAIARSVLGTNSEKTFIDKILARKDIDEVRDLIKKPRLTRAELLEVLYLLSASESKLYNFSAWERYIIMKFFVWIREFIKVAELLYDYQDDLRKREKDGLGQLSPRARKYLDNNERLIEHNAKFLIDLYFMIGRTSLSLGATGFTELLKNKFEINYSGGMKDKQSYNTAVGGENG